MRRTGYTMIVLGAVACALWWCWRGAREEFGAGKKPAEASPQKSISSGPPAKTTIPLDESVGTTGSSAEGASGTASDRRALMKQIRGLLRSDPEQAERLARDYRERYPNGPDAEENEALLVYAVWNGGNFVGAREEVFRYFDLYPGGHYTKELSELTQRYPRPTQQVP